MLQTNMVFAAIDAQHVQPLARQLQASGIKILASANLRLVTHLDVSVRDIEIVLGAFREYFRNS